MNKPLHKDPAATGPVSFGSDEQRIAEATVPVAILVCHGMGQQVRYETISGVAQAICREATERDCQIDPIGVRLTEANGGFLPRAELRWVDSEQRLHEVHVYEAYWAPLTEGQVTYRDTLLFLANAAWNGLLNSKLLRRGSFKRWMFGEPKDLPTGRATFLAVLTVALFVLVQAAVALLASIELTNWVKKLQDAFAADGAMQRLRAFLTDPSWWAHSVLLLGLAVGAYFWRYFAVQFIGDVAAYISPYKDSKFDDLRGRIRAIGLNVGKVVYGFGPPSVGVPHYGKVVVAGHSLGSVLAYDTLNSLIDLDNVSRPEDRRAVVQRTRALITFGSPLDKTAFIFRVQAKKAEDWIRERLAAAMQPLILSYDEYRPAGFKWVNIWSKQDVISGELKYYDCPSVPVDDPRHVQNMVDPEANWPLYAHVQYWNNKMLRTQLYDAIG